MTAMSQGWKGETNKKTINKVPVQHIKLYTATLKQIHISLKCILKTLGLPPICFKGITDNAMC